MKKKSKKANKINLKKLDKQDKALLGTMALLIVLVAVLAIMALGLKNNNNSNKKVNIIIPILEEKTQNEIGVDLSQMSIGETKEYIFKVSNYKSREVNKKNVKYDIVITSSENATIELYKEDSNKNLVAKENYEIKGNKLPKNKKSEDEYHMIIKVTKKPTKTDKITLKINS